jgi:hypothetical protein
MTVMMMVQVTTFFELIKERRTQTKLSWYVDSDATSHMTSGESFFSELYKIENTVFLADNSGIAVKGISNSELMCITPTRDNLRITVNDVMYVPSLHGGLLSTSCLT